MCSERQCAASSEGYVILSRGASECVCLGGCG